MRNSSKVTCTGNSDDGIHRKSGKVSECSETLNNMEMFDNGRFDLVTN